MDGVPGAQGYDAQADTLIERYEAIPFEVGHAAILDLIPKEPSDILDIGAGTGRDAAYFAGIGHRVTAVEPTDAFRTYAEANHPSPNIVWVDDALPHLTALDDQSACFDFVSLTAVWMHLDEAERTQGMAVLSRLLRPSGIVVLSLRHGPVPAGRVMYDVSAEETILLAGHHSLTAIQQVHTESIQEPNKSAGVTWSRLAFRKKPETEKV